MPKKNDTLSQARTSRNDEFYTQYEDIQREVNSYLEYNPDTFRNKVVLLPCDDPEWSNFTRFFAQNFELLGLKKLISTSYAPDSKKRNYGFNEEYYQFTLFDLTSFEKDNPNYNEKITHTNGKIFILERDTNQSGNVDIDDLEWSYLNGDGDFRSEEVRKLRDEADIIITNPPFSLFREFVAWIMEANKKYLIIGNQNAITYKEIFPLLRDGKMWIGNRFNQRINGKNMTFSVPDSYPLTGTEVERDSNGKKLIAVAGTGWFTNIEHGRRHQPLSLMTMADNLKFSKHKELIELGYQKFDNYDAINIPYSDAIPSDYEGVMGVPITFLSKHCPEQFEIIGIACGNSWANYPDTLKSLNFNPNMKYGGGLGSGIINGKATYARILIRKRADFNENNA